MEKASKTSNQDQFRLNALVAATAFLDVLVLCVLSVALEHADADDDVRWPWELSIASSIFRLCLILATVLFVDYASQIRQVVAIILVILGVVVGSVEFSLAPRQVVQEDWHGPLTFACVICFALLEGLVMFLAQYMAFKATKSQQLSDLERGLLSQADRPDEEEEEEYIPEPDTYKGQGANFSRLLALAYPERYILVVATIALFLSSIATVATPALFGRLIQTISVTKDEGELNRTMLYLVVLFTVSSIFAMIRGALYTLAGERLVARFRVRLFDHVLHNDIAFFDTSQSGELQSRLSTDTGVLQNAVTVNVSMLLRWLFQAIASLVILFYISWKLTLIMLGIVPGLAVGASFYGKYIGRISKAYQEALAKAAETAEEAFGNVRTVRSFSKEGFEVQRYKSRIRVSYEQGKRRAWAYGIFLGVIGLAVFLAIALVLWLGGRMVIRGTDGLTSADLTSFLLYTMNLSFSLGGLSEIYSTLSSAVGSSTRMFSLLDQEPKIGSRKPRASSLMRNNSLSRGGHLKFDNVKFTYPSRPDVEVLKGVTIDCPRGTVNALVGPSGAGKSSIVLLAQRFYDPLQGQILIDDQPLTQIEPFQLHSRMAVVSQEPCLFACSIGENISYGLHRKVTSQEIEEAARKANALEFINRFPNGLETLVGERGVQLSGGQKQRIAIARAMLVDPEILLLDEATSALDSESEHLVQQALDSLMKNRTTIIVAHRLSTVRDADQIFVLDGGLVVEKGPHEELVKISGGLYASLVARQLR